ncbi:MAG TPA: hypothetical protein VMM56_12550 [Planctomycetaceae bacterium]|nr:hypothetical protein [Planctomycetaceae bacterium]
MRIHSKALLTFGCLFLLASTSFAEFPWNPLSLIKGSDENKPRPITFETRRLMVQESQYYPPNQSRMFLDSFDGLSDEQAREKLKVSRSNRIQNTAGMSSTGSRATAPAATARVGAGQTSMRSSVANPPARQTTRSTVGTADLGSQSPWNRNRTSQSAAGTYDQSPGSQSAGIRSAEMNQPNPPTGRNIIPSGYGQLPSALGDRGTTRQIPTSDDSASRVTPGNPFLPASYTGYNSSLDNQNHTMVVRPARGSAAEAKNFSVNYKPAAEDREAILPQKSVNQAATFGNSNRNTRPDLGLMLDQAEAAIAASHPGQSEQEYQAHITRHVELRLLYLLAGQRDRAIAAIPGIHANEQAFWTRVFWSLSNYLDEQNYPDKADRTAAALSQMRAAILALQGNAPLAIGRATFCSDIVSFGNYTRFEKEEFRSGQEVLVYAELENFQSERTADGKYRTLLKSSVRLAQDGRAVDEVQYNATEDLSRSRRQDFMQGFRYQLPQRLAPGNYVLQLTIEDQLSSKSAQYSLNLRVR